MKKRRQHKSQGKTGNDGFSLLELIISITILAIIMLPLMSNFFRSMQMNKKAGEMQVQNNLASNIMEGLKALDLKSILEQFNGPIEDFNIITDSSDERTVDQVMRLTYQDSTNEYSAYDPTAEQASYYFAINKIIVGGTAYDALIKIDPSKYQESAGIMNDYPMPDMINLDEKVNVLLQSDQNDSFDGAALAAFGERGEVYAKAEFENSPAYLAYLKELDEWQKQREEAEMGGTAPPQKPTVPVLDPADYPDYCNLVILKSKITKTMKITVNNRTIDYQIIYECAWTADNIEKSIRYEIIRTQYPKLIKDVYLFYRPSVFNISSDVIEIENQNTVNPVNLFVAEQDGVIFSNLTISRSSEEDNIMTYTNLNDSEVSVKIGGFLKSGDERGLTSGIVKTEKKDRIYDITVNIYEYVDSVNQEDKYQKLLYTLESSKEE
jgi:prepilin-type N-terminal cleavage/methylation domain-containing protein